MIDGSSAVVPFTRSIEFDYSQLDQGQDARLRDIEHQIHSEFMGLHARMLVIGHLLNGAKFELGHGRFMAWLEATFPTLAGRTTRRYMQLARRELAKVANLEAVTEITEADRSRRGKALEKKAAMAKSARRGRSISALRLLTMMQAHMPKAVYSQAVGAISTTGIEELLGVAQRLHALFPDYHAHQVEILERNAQADAANDFPFVATPWEADYLVLADDDESRAAVNLEQPS